MGRIIPKHKPKGIQDFSKKKVKVGKKIAKENVTVVNVKSKVIFVPNQLRESNNNTPLAMVNKQTQLFHHHTPSTRNSAVGAILNSVVSKELPEVIIPLVISPLVELILDEEKDVRKAALQLFEALFKMYDASVFAESMKIVISYICTGLTMIEKANRTDSLHLLKLICQYKGILVFVKDKTKIFEILLQMLSDSLFGFKLAETSDPNKAKSASERAQKMKTQFILLLEVISSLFSSRVSHEYCVTSDGRSTDNNGYRNTNLSLNFIMLQGLGTLSGSESIAKHGKVVLSKEFGEKLLYAWSILTVDELLADEVISQLSLVVHAIKALVLCIFNDDCPSSIELLLLIAYHLWHSVNTTGKEANFPYLSKSLSVGVNVENSRSLINNLNKCIMRRLSWQDIFIEKLKIRQEQYIRQTSTASQNHLQDLLLSYLEGFKSSCGRSLNVSRVDEILSLLRENIMVFLPLSNTESDVLFNGLFEILDTVSSVFQSKEYNIKQADLHVPLMFSRNLIALHEVFVEFKFLKDDSVNCSLLKKFFPTINTLIEVSSSALKDGIASMDSNLSGLTILFQCMQCVTEISKCWKVEVLHSTDAVWSAIRSSISNCSCKILSAVNEVEIKESTDIPLKVRKALIELISYSLYSFSNADGIRADLAEVLKKFPVQFNPLL